MWISESIADTLVVEVKRYSLREMELFLCILARNIWFFVSYQYSLIQYIIVKYCESPITTTLHRETFKYLRRTQKSRAS